LFELKQLIMLHSKFLMCYISQPITSGTSVVKCVFVVVQEDDSFFYPVSSQLVSGFGQCSIDNLMSCNCS